MTLLSKNKIFSIFLTILCGFVSGDLFLRLYGIVFAYLADIRAIGWIRIFPKSIRSIAYWLHFFIVEVFVLAIVIIIIGCIVGAFLKIEKLKASIISFICFLLTKSFYHYKVWNEFSFMNSPLIYFLVVSIITFLMFWYSFCLGGFLRSRIR